MEAKLDCGDTSCEFAESKTGMRTNGGCYCLKDLPFDRRIAVRRYIKALREENARLRVHSERQSGMIRDLTIRAEAAEAAHAQVVEGLRQAREGWKQAEAEVARHKRNAECYACEAGDPDMDGVQDTKLSRAEAEVARLEGLILNWWTRISASSARHIMLDLMDEARRINASHDRCPNCEGTGATGAGVLCCAAAPEVK